MRARGLKPFNCHVVNEKTSVAPHAGAWIETVIIVPGALPVKVAPHAGAWIETLAKEKEKELG